MSPHVYCHRVHRNSPPAILLREGWREGHKTRQRTLANLSHWPMEKIETFRRLLHDEPLVSAHDRCTTEKTLAHGHVQAILEMIGKLELESLLSTQPGRERDLVLAMIVQRLLAPCSKLATTQHWHTTTLAEELEVAEASENDLYEAMDWLLERKERIEKKLATRHLSEGGLVLYDVSSSFYEGRTCPLVQFGHDRDGKKGLPIIVYERSRKREVFLEATEKSLEKIGKEVARRKKKPLTAAENGLKVGKVLGRYKVGKHFECKIGAGRFVSSRHAKSIEQEERLDGIYVLLTSEPAERLSAEDTVRSYKSLAEVERAFRF